MTADDLPSYYAGSRRIQPDTRLGQHARFRMLLGFCAAAAALGQAPPGRDLSQVSLEDLMNYQVTSVSKKEQKLSDAAAAVFVISQEDIRRSGATSVPELLRMAPGVDVARIDANRWAISIRGFNDAYANKVLVLVDGRSVYNPTYSGVFWENQNVPLEDIDRIEVIRGPGGTVWGANAVNGVINIITKSARVTTGGLIAAGAGSQDPGDALLQYGREAGHKGAYRVFGRYLDVSDSDLVQGSPGGDAWHAWLAGFRSDWNLSARDALTVQGDLHRSQGNQALMTIFSNDLSRPMAGLSDPINTASGNVLGRWTHTLEDGSEMSLQLYDDYYSHTEEAFHELVNTVDADFEQHVAAGSRNDVVWGMGARGIGSHYQPGYAFSILPARRMDVLLSTFIQDEVSVTDTLRLTFGSKFEHNDFSGFEFEPSAQLAWAAGPNRTVWLSAARAIRQPNPFGAGMQWDAATFPADGTLGVVRILGNPNQKTERLYDFEAGYRTQATKRLSLDVTGFASFYHDLVTVETGKPYFVSNARMPYLVLPVVFENTARANTHGVELSAIWKLSDHWQITPSYSWLHGIIRGAQAALPSAGLTPGSAPDHQFQLRSLQDFGRKVEWDNRLAYVGRLSFGNVPGYLRLDSRLGWRLSEFLELSVVGQNLLEPRHQEFADEYGFIHANIRRSIFGKMTWRF